MKNYEGRHSALKKKINGHLHKLTGNDFDFYSGLSQTDLIELKTALSDINNVLTFKTTISAANWLCNYFFIDRKSKERILQVIDKTKPNTKGFDIKIDEPVKILAEVKCISPVNNGEKFGAAQWNSILDDFYNLKNGKGKWDDTSGYYKFLFLLDLGDRTDNAVKQLLQISKGTSDKPLRLNRHEIKTHISLFTEDLTVRKLRLDKVYLKKMIIKK